jgi:hypothetical protein
MAQLRTPKIVRSGALLLALAAGFAGCASVDEQQELAYTEDAATIGRSVDETLATIEPASDEDPPPADTYREAARELGVAATDLEKIEAPEQVSGAHDNLIDGTAGLAKEFARLADELDAAATDRERMDIMLAFADRTPVVEAFANLDAARNQFDDAGYKVMATSSD